MPGLSRAAHTEAANRLMVEGSRASRNNITLILLHFNASLILARSGESERTNFRLGCGVVVGLWFVRSLAADLIPLLRNQSFDSLLVCSFARRARARPPAFRRSATAFRPRRGGVSHPLSLEPR